MLDSAIIHSNILFLFCVNFWAEGGGGGSTRLLDSTIVHSNILFFFCVNFWAEGGWGTKHFLTLGIRNFLVTVLEEEGGTTFSEIFFKYSLPSIPPPPTPTPHST